MNALNRQIQNGEEVIVRRELMNAENQELPRRVFVAEHGFGMQSFTSGTAIMGYWKDGGQVARVNGDELDPEETGQYQATQDEQRKMDALAADREAHDDR